MSMKSRLRGSAFVATLFFFLCAFTSSQKVAAQITLTMNNATLGQVIELVKSQSKYQFFYDDQLSTQTVKHVSVSNASIETLLTQVLKGTQVTYKIEDNVVYLSVGKKVAKSGPVKQVAARKVTGAVVDANGEPLIGVNVSIEGTATGTITDFDGKYMLNVPEKTKIVFSYIGYKQMILLPKSNVLNVTMNEDTQTIDEVVVTALGIKREKKMLGYAIQDLKGDEVNKTGDPSITSMLGGKVAGLQMNTSSTGLGGSTKITLRGNSSLTDNNQPLWVVDGVPFNDNNDSSASAWGGVDRGGAAVDINPDDIESISVLKGPNAAALYGSRAGNGVILITTKKGTKSEGFGVSYSGSFTWTQTASTLDMQHKYGQGGNGEFDGNSWYSYGAPLDGHTYSSEHYGEQKYQDHGDVMKDYFNTGFAQTHNIAVGNVTEKANYRASVGYTKADGMFNKESMNKLNIDVKAGMTMNKYFSIDSKISLSRTANNNRPVFGQSGEVYQLLFLPTNVSLNSIQKYRDADTRHIYYKSPGPGYGNPYYINYRYTNHDERWRAFGYYALRFNFTEWLHASAKYSFDYYNTSIEEIDRTDGCSMAQEEESYNTSEARFFEQNIEFMLSGDNQITDKFRLGYTLGANFMYQKSTGLSGRSENMNTPGYWYHNSAQGFNRVHNLPFVRRKTNSVFATTQLAWDEYLSLDLTARNDWSSTLPKDNRSYFYPSANLSFVLSDFMDRMDWNRPSWITFAKVRLSASQVGKDTEPYQLQNYLGWSQESSGAVSHPSDVKANPDLKPEISTAYEAGLDMKFFNNRLGFDFTYYQSYTRNQIMKVPAPPSSGFSYNRINAGEVVNKGFELMIYSTPIQTKDFTFDLGLNLAHNKTTVKTLSEEVPYLSLAYGIKDMMVDVRANAGGNLGDIYPNKTFKKDENGNVITRNGRPLDSGENPTEAIGNIQPDFLASVSPSFTYKGVTLSALIDMKFGGEICSVSEAIATSYGTAARTENREDIVVKGLDEITGKPNTVAIPAEEYYKMIGGTNGYAEYFMYDASFIKLKEIALSYSFPRQLLKKTPLSSLRISLVGRNLCYLMKHTPGTSPEGGFNTTMFSQAVDYTSVPYSRTFGFSVKLGF